MASSSSSSAAAHTGAFIHSSAPLGRRLPGAEVNLCQLYMFFDELEWVEVHHCGSWSSLKPEQLLEEIRNFFSLEYEVHLLFLICHGTQDGFWELSQGSRPLTFHDVMTQWELAQQARRELGEQDGQAHQLEIVTDSCFSGRVVFDAAQRGHRDVFVQAACGVGGVEYVLDDVAATFTAAWIRQQRLHFGLLTQTPEEAELERRVGYCRAYDPCYWLPDRQIQWALIGEPFERQQEEMRRQQIFQFGLWGIKSFGSEDLCFMEDKARCLAFLDDVRLQSVSWELQYQCGIHDFVRVATLSAFARKYPHRKSIFLPQRAMDIDSFTWDGEHRDAAQVWWISGVITLRLYKQLGDLEDADKLRLMAIDIVESKRLSHGVLADFHIALATLCEAGVWDVNLLPKAAEMFRIEDTPRRQINLAARAVEFWKTAHHHACRADRQFLALLCAYSGAFLHRTFVSTDGEKFIRLIQDTLKPALFVANDVMGSLPNSLLRFLSTGEATDYFACRSGYGNGSRCLRAALWRSLLVVSQSASLDIVALVKRAAPFGKLVR